MLDGAALAARAVGAREAIIAVPDTDERSIRSLEHAIDERAGAQLRDEPRLSLFLTPKRYIAGQESALINLVNTDLPAPTFGAPPFERGVRQLPTLVQNVETLAHLALIARHGPQWFRQIGTAEDPGSALITLSGAVRAPGVYEIEHGTPLSDVLASAGADEPVTAVLVGGYFGSWVEPAYVPRLLLRAWGAGGVRRDARCGGDRGARRGRLRRCRDRAGGRLPRCRGRRSVRSLRQRPCRDRRRGSAHVNRYRACGGPARPRALVQRAAESGGLRAPGRGAAVRLERAARVRREFDDHARHGRCERCASGPLLPAPSWQPYAPAA